MRFQTFHGIALNEFFFLDCKQNHQRKIFQETATSLSQDLGVSTKSVQSVIDLVSSVENMILETVGHFAFTFRVWDLSFSYISCRIWDSLPQEGMIVIFPGYEVGETRTK